MRFLTFFSLAVLLFSYNNTNVHAQDTAVEASGDVAESVVEPTQVPDTEAVKEEAKKTNVFSRATDKQIGEAQRFYKKCKNNETLSARKDCKCAATAYLETRLELGEDATIEQIIAENVNSCLKDEKTTIEKPDDIDLDVTETQMKEAESVFNTCKANLSFANKIDCECLAAEFLERRINLGPILGRDIIIGQVASTNLCHNTVGATGQEYSNCMKEDIPRTGKIEPKKFCECYARKWSKFISDHVGVLGPDMEGSYQLFSRVHCLQESSYE